MSPGHPHVSFGSLWKSLGSGYTRNSLCVTNIAARTSMKSRVSPTGSYLFRLQKKRHLRTKPAKKLMRFSQALRPSPV